MRLNKFDTQTIVFRRFVSSTNQQICAHAVELLCVLRHVCQLVSVQPPRVSEQLIVVCVQLAEPNLFALEKQVCGQGS